MVEAGHSSSPGHADTRAIDVSPVDGNLLNEWFEGSMIEPSVTYGNQYLSLTHQFAQKWHG